MTIFDGILILAVLGCALAPFAVGYFLFRRKFRRAKRVLLVLAGFLVVYAAVLVSVSLLSPQRVLAMHQDRCFDDWCLSVEQVAQQPTIGSAPLLVTAHGVFDVPKGSSHLALVVTHGLFPDVLVIGSEQSFLHKPTIIQLPSP